jgi:hypothetical protein
VTHTTSLVFTVTIPLTPGTEYRTDALENALAKAEREAVADDKITPGTLPSGTATMFEPGSAPSLRVWWNL